MSEIIIDRYHPFRYGDVTPELSIELAVSPVVRIGEAVLRWSGVDVEVGTGVIPQNAPIEALALEFYTLTGAGSPLAPNGLASYFNFVRIVSKQPERQL
jgi:hypothetical protein